MKLARHHCSNDTPTISVNLHHFCCTKKHLFSGGYIVIPIKEIKLDINCEHLIKQEVISKPSLLRGSNCKMYNDYDTLLDHTEYMLQSIA